MDTSHRKRGRPRGTGKDDAVYLSKVADLMVEDTTLRASTAMRRVIYSAGRPYSLTGEATFLRRLQVKWKEQGPGLLQAASARRSQKRAAQAVSGVAAGAKYAEMGLSRLYQSPEFQTFLERYGCLADQTVRLCQSPELQALAAKYHRFADQTNGWLRQPGVLRALEIASRFQSAYCKIIHSPQGGTVSS